MVRMTFTDLVPWRRSPRDIRVRREQDDLVGSFYREMNNLMDYFFHGFDIEPFGTRELADGEFMPRVDIKEDEKEIKVTAELPGMENKDIDVTLSRDSLTIKGEKQQETEDKGKDYYRAERRYGSFQRAIPLSTEIDGDKTRADFRNGVLTVTLAKTAKARERKKKIQIKSA